jgi:hypothetical protein
LDRLTALLVLVVALPVSAQDTPPPGLEAVEVARSVRCIDVLTRLEALDVQLGPLAIRAQRLVAIAGAIAVEEASVVDSLRVTDPVEAAVADWFRADQALAQRYLSAPNQAILDERTAARGAIQQRVAAAMAEVQGEADSVVAPTGTLRSDSVDCSGAILVRGPALEACQGLTSRVCQAARDSTVAEPFRFVDSADLLWYRQEMRPWTAPGPLQVSPDGQLGGARTMSYTRTGNIVVSIAFNPMLRAREDLTPEQLAALDSIDAALGIQNDHPEVTFAPAL